MALPKHPIMDVEDYLILDRNSKNARYEYLDGEMRMLAGGSTYHSAIIANLVGTIGRFLESSPCWVFNTHAMRNEMRRAEKMVCHACSLKRLCSR